MKPICSLLLMRIASSRRTPANLRRRCCKLLWKISADNFWSEEKRWCYKTLLGIQMGYGSYSADGLELGLPSGTLIGNYTSIGPGVVGFNANHLLDHFTTHPLLYNPLCGVVKSDSLSRTKLLIGHDVWIGARTVILPNVSRIGNGAVIGAGTIVTKDIPDYAIVKGNPGRVAKYRFSAETIAEITKSEWWNLDINELTKSIPQYENIVRLQAL